MQPHRLALHTSGPSGRVMGNLQARLSSRLPVSQRDASKQSLCAVCITMRRPWATRCPSASSEATTHVLPVHAASRHSAWVALVTTYRHDWLCTMAREGLGSVRGFACDDYAALKTQ